MAGVTGARGSSRRKILVCGGLILGIAVVLLAGVMAETSVKQVYWAVYSRLHPMRDFGEFGDSTGFSLESTFPGERYDKSSSKQHNAAEKAIKAGEKEEVRLVKTETDKIKHRDDEKMAATEAKLRHSDKETMKEKENVEDLAEQLSQKATAAFSAEIEAVAGSEEADRLTDGLQRDQNQKQTRLEREAEQAAAKSSKGAGLRKTLWQSLKFGQ